ncbi:uncharacterized protein DUF2505 [Rarobacter incanus]|uniref:Uncharacterized protein DUF2505 n=2 Tax=Rarobacter incanus TaxID=153494 RepID=A0A542SNV3_9MICO|nr:uncharacterized protein DUF2505 [Rarobacter incanus]
MQVDVATAVAYSTSAVVSALCDEDFITFVTAKTGATVTHITTTSQTNGAATVVVRRNLPTTVIPAQARAFVGSNLELREVDAWAEPMQGADGPRYGTIAIEVAGVPAHASGHVRVLPTEGGCNLRYDLTVRATVPLFGAVIERQVADGVRTAVDALCAALEEWLKSRSGE